MWQVFLNFYQNTSLIKKSKEFLGGKAVRRLFVLMVAVSLLAAGCLGGNGGLGWAGRSIIGGDGNNQSGYSVSGIVTKPDGKGVGGVTVSVDGIATTQTDPDGKWTLDGLSGTVTVNYVKDDWIFWPPSEAISQATDDLTTVGNLHGEGYYPLAEGNEWKWENSDFVNIQRIVSKETRDGLTVFTIESLYKYFYDEWFEDVSEVQVWRDGDRYYFGSADEDLGEGPVELMTVPIEVGPEVVFAGAPYAATIEKIDIPKGRFTAIKLTYNDNDVELVHSWFVPYVGTVMRGSDLYNEDTGKWEDAGRFPITDYVLNW